MSEVKQPLKRLSIGQVSVSLWENEAEDGDGSKRTFKSVTISRQYFDRKTGEWKWQRVTLKTGEAPQVAELLKKIVEDDSEPEPECPF